MIRTARTSPLLAIGAMMLAGAAVPAAAQQPGRIVIVEPQPQVIFRGDGMPISLDKGRFVAEEDPAAPARLTELIAGLGSGDVRIREQAARNLEDDRGIPLAMIEKALRDGRGTMSLEARTRLIATARDRFWRTPRGAMGIQFWNGLSSRVVVEQTFKEFDASNKIEDGDMIVRADGREIDGPAAQQRLQAVIVSHDPGEKVSLVIRRGEKRLELEVTLGRREDLANAILTDAIMIRAWQQRLGAMIEPDRAPPITTALGAKDWPVNPVGLNRSQSLRRKGVDNAGIGAVGGGLPRGADLTIDAISQRMAQGQVRNPRAAQQIIWQQNVWAGGMAWDPNAEPTMPGMTRRQELELMEASRLALVRDRERLDRINPGGANQPVIINRNVPGSTASPSKTLEIIDKQVRALRAEMAEHGETPDAAKDSVKADPSPDDGDKKTPPDQP